MRDFQRLMRNTIIFTNIYFVVRKLSHVKKYFSSYWIRSAFYSILQRFSTTFFGLINFVILVRVVPKPQMGVWELFLTVTTIFEMTKTGLLKNAHVRYVTNELEEKSEIASSSVVINLAISLLFIILVILFAPWLSNIFKVRQELAMMLRWYIPGILMLVYFAHLEAVQQSHLDFKGVFAGYLVRQVVFFVLITGSWLLHYVFTLWDVVIYQLISIFLGTITLYFYSRPYLYHRFNPTWVWIKRILSYGKFIFASGAVSNIFQNLDKIMTGTFLSSSAVASYGAAARMNIFLDTPSFAAADILFPKSSRASVEEGTEKVRYLFERMVGVLMSFTVPLSIFIILFPRPIILLIAGRQYLDAAPILQLYMIAGLARPLHNQAANLLNSIGKPAITLWMNALALVVNLGINYLLLKSIGFYGAALGTSISSITILIVWYFLMRRLIGFSPRSTYEYMIGTYKTVWNQGMKMLRGEKA
jgi:lipopolysaccharide exporter